MELHLRTKILSDGWKYIAWCDEGILLTSTDKHYADILIDNRRVYFGRAEATEEDKLIFKCKQMEED
jgi:hypothetical protein